MTKEDKIKAYAMTLDGYTYQSIANEFGVTKQYISSLFGRKLYNAKLYDEIIYPNITKWMEENKVTVRSLSIELYSEQSPNVAQTKLSKKLKGERKFTIDDIDKILKITGMKYEEAFERKENK